MATLAPVTWAQRKASLYLTINVADVDKDSSIIKLESSKLTFTGKARGKEYSATLEFFAEVDAQDAVRGDGDARAWEARGARAAEEGLCARRRRHGRAIACYAQARAATMR